jgi:hypothetical protein
MAPRTRRGAMLIPVNSACITALSNSTHGIIVLPTTIQLSAALAKLAMTLDKRPDLTRRLRRLSNVDQSGEGRKTLVESTAELIQRAFTMCLTERSWNRNGVGKDGRPDGRKGGIYSFANLVLKLLFQVFLHILPLSSLSNPLQVSQNSARQSTLHKHITALAAVSSLPG